MDVEAQRRVESLKHNGGTTEPKSTGNSSTEEVQKIPGPKTPLMDLDGGLVGWESETDPMNPL
jgi:hypothetical protein